MRALILGATGQDGSYLAEQLAADRCAVWAVVRRHTPGLSMPAIVGDLLDQSSLEMALRVSQPDVVFNLAAITSPGGRWGTPQPPLLADVTAVGVVHLLDAMVKCAPNAKLVHASSSAIHDPQRYGLYGIAKQFAHEAVAGYRSHLWTSNAVLYSHTSPRQDPRFLSRRICSTVARIATGSGERLVLGDVESRRDWGYAPDCVRAMRTIADLDTPGDWTVATGQTHSVRDMVDVALKTAGLGWDVVDTDPGQHVPDEMPPVLPTVPGWFPATSFSDMIAELTQ